MPGIVGQGLTFNLPNYYGELLSLSPADTPFTTAIGGLSGGKRSNGQTEFEWQAYDLRDAETRVRLEGADAPAAEHRTRLKLDNILEIHQEAVDVSYTKQAATHMYSGLNLGGPLNPVTDELSWQVTQSLKQVGLDLEHSFLNGAYNKPGDNTTARQTRGLIAATRLGVNGKANVIDKAAAVLDGVTVTVSNNRFADTGHGLSDGDAVRLDGGPSVGFSDRRVYYVVGQAANWFSLASAPGGSAITPSVDGTVDVVALGEATYSDVLDVVQLAYENGGVEDGSATLIVGAAAKRWLTNEFVTQAGYQEATRNVGGVSVTTIITDFGTLNLMLSRIVPTYAILFAGLHLCAPVFLEIPGKGFLFVEPLAKTGATDKAQLYGEIGLEYGNPLGHALLDGVSFA